METQSVQIKKRSSKGSQYYGVSTIITEQGRLVWGATLTSDLLPAIFSSERQAALHVDKRLIAMGKEPRNILKFVSRRVAE